MRLAGYGRLGDVADPAVLGRHGISIVPAQQPADVALGVGWPALGDLAGIPAPRHALWIADLDGALPEPAPGVALVLGAGWLLRQLEPALPGRRLWLVRPGLDRTAFPPGPEPAPWVDGPLRVSGTRAALRGLGRRRASGRLQLIEVPAGASAAERAAAYRAAHVAVAPGRPVEAFACGAAVVARDGPAAREEVDPGGDGLLVAAGQGVAEAVDRLAGEPRELHLLRHGAWRSAAAWPSTAQQGAVLAAVLRQVARAGPPAPLDDLARALPRRPRLARLRGALAAARR